MKIMWERLKEMSEVELENLEWRPHSDLPRVLFLIIQEINRRAKMEKING